MKTWPTLDLLNPDRLPQSQEAIEQALNERALFILQTYIDVLTDTPQEEKFSVKRELLDALYEKEVGLEPVAVSVGASKERHSEHDGYFGVRRIDGKLPSLLFMRSLFTIHSELAEEKMKTGFNAMPCEYHRIEQALQALFSYMTPPRLKPTVETIRQVLVKSHPNTLEPESGYRWRIGHHIFAALIQGLIIAFNGFESACEEKEEQREKEALELATILMDGSEAAILLTSAFPSSDYTQRIRPAMSPPHLEAGFSGLQSIDHLYLAKQLRRLCPLFKQLSPCLLSPYHELLNTFDSMYAAHKHICAYFVGATAPSLRMGNQDQRPAIEKLEKLRQTRLESLKF